MLLMALSGAAVLALVCWAALRESETTADAVIPRAGSGAHDDTMREASQAPPSPSVAAALATTPDGLDDATVADADTEEALAAAAALWTVLIQDRG